MLSPDIQSLIQILSRLPGLGPRSGQRLGLYLIKNRHQVIPMLVKALQTVYSSVRTCEECFNWDTQSPCWICRHEKRRNPLLCVVESVPDLWAFERSHFYNGRYHILGGTLSALEGITPDQLTIQPLLKRLDTGSFEEVLLGLNPTVSGQTTLYYLLESLRSYPIKITMLAQGIPIGGELDYLDEKTLTLAFESRQTLQKLTEEVDCKHSIVEKRPVLAEAG
jgi:recombination protein RecR